MLSTEWPLFFNSREDFANALHFLRRQHDYDLFEKVVRELASYSHENTSPRRKIKLSELSAYTNAILADYKSSKYKKVFTLCRCEKSKTLVHGLPDIGWTVADAWLHKIFRTHRAQIQLSTLNMLVGRMMVVGDRFYIYSGYPVVNRQKALDTIQKKLTHLEERVSIVDLEIQKEYESELLDLRTSKILLEELILEEEQKQKQKQ